MEFKIFFLLTALNAMVHGSPSVKVARRQRSASTCGVSGEEIEQLDSGNNITRGSFPWIVALMQTSTSPPTFFCGGTLISEAFVISAAHCVTQQDSLKVLLPRDILALFGAHELSNPYEVEKISVSPKKIYVHEDWDAGTLSADILLLEFERESFYFSAFIRPICLWDSENEPAVREGLVVNWSKRQNTSNEQENTPKVNKIPILANKHCFSGKKTLVDLSSINTFCGGQGNDFQVCNDGSGGGFVFKRKGVYYLKGIESSALIKEGDCRSDCNAIFTDVSKYKDWIRTSSEVLRNVSCIPRIVTSPYLKRKVEACEISEAIYNKHFVVQLGSSIINSYEVLYIDDNKEVNFLPKNIGDNFSNLKEIAISNCSLNLLIRDGFRKLEKLQFLRLDLNEIAIIEPDAFKDLVGVKKLRLDNNLIETFDGELLNSMIKLEEIDLRNNKIKFLSPTTFTIPDGILDFVELEGNVCVTSNYFSNVNLKELKPDLESKCTANVPKLSKKDLKEVLCKFERTNSTELKKMVNTCFPKQTISSEDFYFLESPVYNNVEHFGTYNNKEVKFLPRNVGKKFPDLKSFYFHNCSLMVVRDYYFENMSKLLFIGLRDNGIATIEANAFKDLISVEKLWLLNNQIETLDKKLFVAMISLQEIYLQNNKISHLYPTTFTIPGGKLTFVNLQTNICLNLNYFLEITLDELESDLKSKCSKNELALSTQDSKQVVCRFVWRNSIRLKKSVFSCLVNQSMGSEDFYFLESSIYTDIEYFEIVGNNLVSKYLPKNVGKKFPDLREISVNNCGLTVVRNHYFQNMDKLQTLSLISNQITIIESDAFKDLISLQILWLANNQIETLDEKHLTSMVNLEEIQLQNNKIKFLSPTTFKIPGGKLRSVDLERNICINQNYLSDVNMNELESDFGTFCTRSLSQQSTHDPNGITCRFSHIESTRLNKTVTGCFLNQTIESEDFYFHDSPVYTTVEYFDLKRNVKVEHLPKNIGKKFPNLKEIDAKSCGLKTISQVYFQNMQKLQFLQIFANKIRTVEPEAFKDLVSVRKLWLNDNLIETLDEKLFVPMINLQELYLSNNKIKLLNPKTFTIPGGELWYVDLRQNLCLNQYYRSDDNWNQLESDVNATCNGKALEPFKQALGKVSCNWYTVSTSGTNTYGCFVNQTIDNEDDVLDLTVYPTVVNFFIDGQKQVKFLPKQIGEKFPNLSELRTTSCGLVIVRKHYLSKLWNLRLVRMNNNKIAFIESDSFNDLVKVERLWFRNNLIETLDKKLFLPLLKLDLVDFVNNKIKVLSPKTFTIPGGILDLIDLQTNVCINKIYGSADWGHNNLEQLEPDLKLKCSL